MLWVWYKHFYLCRLIACTPVGVRELGTLLHLLGMICCQEDAHQVKPGPRQGMKNLDANLQHKNLKKYDKQLALV